MNDEGHSAEAPIAAPSTAEVPSAPITSATEAAPAPAAPSTAAGEAAGSAEAAVLHMIDKSSLSAAGRVPLNTLQLACMKVPQLSARLSGPQRCKLYTQLLLEEKSLADLPESFAALAAEANETERHAAEQLREVLRLDRTPLEELRGFLFLLRSREDFVYTEDSLAVVAALGTVVAAAQFSTPQEELRLLYHFLAAIHNDFLIGQPSYAYEEATVALLRLILQYHDPELSMHLDHHQISSGVYLLHWSRRLFVLRGGVQEALVFMDWLFILGDPIMIPYMAMAYLVSYRQTLLALTSKEALESYFSRVDLKLPSSKAETVDPALVDGRRIAFIPVWSGKSLLQNADLIYRNNPLSAQRVLEFCLYPQTGTVNKSPESLAHYYASTPCLPLERSDIASSFALHQNPNLEILPIEYIIVDCRSHGSFEYARLPTAIFVGDEVSYDTARLNTVVARLEPTKGLHLSIFGTGRPIVEELNLLKVLSLHLVQRRFPFVSITSGGFKTTIPLIRTQAIRVLHNANAVRATGSTLNVAVGGISSYLRSLQSDEVKQRAEQLKNRAAEQVSAASAWGWGLWQKAQERFAEARHAVEQPASAPSAAAAPVVERTSPAPPASAPAPAAVPAAEPLLKGRVASPDSRRPAQTRVASPTAPQVFSLGEDEEDDDFGLITTVPVAPLRQPPAVKAAPQPSAASDGAPAAAAPAPAAPPAPEAVKAPERPPAPDVSASIDTEFEKLFGVSSPEPSDKPTS